MRGVIPVFTFVALLASPAAAPPGAREVFRALNALRVDREQIYYVRDLHLRKDVVRLSFTEGKLALLQSSEGRVTGAVFTGTGRVIAVPRDAGERRSLAWFLGAPLLDQPFTRAYLRFTDETAEELLKQLRPAGTPPLQDASLADDWDLVVANLNPAHSLRILTDRLSANPQPYFYAGLANTTLGAFEMILDDRREEQVVIGQPQRKEGRQFYDVWTAFPRADASKRARSFSALSFSVSTAILPDLKLEGQATLRLKVLQAGEQMIPLELSRFLQVQSVSDGQGRPLEFFQNEALSREEILERGNDALFVALPEAPRAGDEIELRVAYQGNVISNAGNDVFFVGARGSWYPNPGGMDQFATFDLSFRWPRRLTLVATGRRVELREEGEWRIGRWQADIPIPVAGFNLGEYFAETVDGGTFKVEVYANKQFEQVLLNRLQQFPAQSTALRPPPWRPPPPQPTVMVVPDPPPSPAALIKKLAQDIADSIRFYEKYDGPFPFPSLAVSPIPAGIGQSWPGLLYLTTLSFLPPSAQQRAGVTQRTQEQISELVPFHEVAHQWWGNAVGTGSYRDQWIHEGLASYLALLYAESKHSDEKFLTTWLDRFRDDLVTKQPDQEETPDEAGPLSLGLRLRSSKTAGAFERIFYRKGPWVFHMLRLMMRDPKAANPDERFQQLLRGLLESYRHRALTTDDLQRAVEIVMTPAMDLEGNRSMEWFFDQWVRHTGIPRYSVTFEAKPTAAGDRFIVRGTLKQSGVPETFTAAVPLYAPRVSGKPVLLGTVVTGGAETSFQFTTPQNRPGQARSRPRRLLIDPNRTLLCMPE